MIAENVATMKRGKTGMKSQKHKLLIYRATLDQHNMIKNEKTAKQSGVMEMNLGVVCAV